jgi:hypothetical protein
MPDANEWEFTADAAGWMNSIIEKNDKLPYQGAKCEQRGKGSQKRRDITLRDDKGNVVLTGEVKLPDKKDGGSPYNAAVVKDARTKAIRAKSRYFFTWNVNELVLWDVESGKPDVLENSYRSWRITNIVSSAELEHPDVVIAIQTGLAQFLIEFAAILRGDVAIGHKPPDERFIEVLESSLNMPIRLNMKELEAAYKKPKQKAELDRWMRDEQGWVIYEDAPGIRENIERAAKFSCYSLVNKLVFYEALLKRYGAGLEPLSVPKHIDTGNDLRLHLEALFADARKVTKDYETVFGEQHTAVGNRIPFYADGAVPHWRALIAQIHEFDFSKIDYEVIGTIFVRLLSPEERHKYGQYYTRVEVVDLINSFCILRGDELVMDPACGGGTFLVRAYARKRELMPGRKHGQLLTDLFGVDISHFATHLTTINLATRDLIDDENYPQIARHDFFGVETRKAFVTLPRRIKAKGLGLEHREIDVPLLDAVVGNPPYIRQEDIPKAANKKSPPVGTKEHLLQLIKREASIKLSGRSDIHCYFWPHATTFLKENGYLCLVTSSQWLDVEYGFHLQEWILQNFEIVAILESIDEPWFVGARVATTATILRRQANAGKRDNNTARFVQLRQPMRTLLAHDGTTGGAVAAADAFRDELLDLKADVVGPGYRARLVKQGDLWRDGVRLAELMKSDQRDSDMEEEKDELGDIPAGDYYGGKWGIHLRAPDLWFELLDKLGDKLRPLGEIADVRFGVKTGDDSFFFPKDVSEEALSEEADPTEFEERFGAERKRVEKGQIRIVACGDKLQERRPIEAKYLEPEIHSLMEISAYAASREDTNRYILLVSGDKKDHDGEHVLDYIKWGERSGVSRKSTVASRETTERNWFDLTDSERAAIVLPKIQQYRLISFLNPEKLYQNSSLLGIYVPKAEAATLCAVLNSTIAVLARLLYARVLGNEANIQLDVYSAKMMLVPDVESFPKGKAKERFLAAFDKMLSREALSFVSDRRRGELVLRAEGREDELQGLSDETELDMVDRRELDDALLELIGIASKKERADILDHLYSYLRDHFELARRKEELGIQNRNTSRRLGAVRPEDLAEEIMERIRREQPYMLRAYDFFLDKSKPYVTVEVPLDGEPKPYKGLFHEHGVEFVKGKKSLAIVELKNDAQVSLAMTLVGNGVRGLVRLPINAADSSTMAKLVTAHIAQSGAKLRELVEDRTSDEDMQASVTDLVRASLQAAVYG